MSQKKIIIPNSWYRLYRSKLQINDKVFDKTKTNLFADENTEYIFKFPKTISNTSTITARDYFYDSFKIKGNLTFDCNIGNLNFIIHPLTQADNNYPWTSNRFDFLDTKKLSIINGNQVWIAIEPVIYYMGPNIKQYSPLPLKEINAQGNKINIKLATIPNLEKVVVNLPEQKNKNDFRNFQFLEFKNCPKLKVVDLSNVGKNNYFDIYIDKKTNQDLVFRFKKDQNFPPETLNFLFQINNSFTKEYLNEYPVYKLMDIKNPTDIIEVKYSDLIKKIQKKYNKIVDEVWEANLKKPSGPVR